MYNRRAVSPVIATVILLGIGLFVALSISVLYRETAFTYVQAELIEHPYIFCSAAKDILNARWKIELSVKNRGTQSVHITDVFVNERPVDEYGLVAGGSLSNGYLIGTSLPFDVVNLQPGESLELYVWIGEDRFSSGTTVLVRIGSVNNVSQNISVKLC